MKNAIARQCAIIAVSDISAIPAAVGRASYYADLLELRLDFLQNITLSHLDQIRAACPLPSIVTCRSKTHRGQFAGSVWQQAEILQYANSLGFEYVDVDVSIAENIPINTQLSKRILSYHDFDATPTLERLNEVKQIMQNNHANIMKFATYVNSKEDNNTLLRFLLTKKRDEEMIVLGMGKIGRISRILTPLLGGYLTYTNSSNSRETSVGDICEKEMSELFHRIKKFINN